MVDNYILSLHVYTHVFGQLNGFLLLLMHTPNIEFSHWKVKSKAVKIS